MKIFPEGSKDEVRGFESKIRFLEGFFDPPFDHLKSPGRYKTFFLKYF